jgi:hypothetical protein
VPTVLRATFQTRARWPSCAPTQYTLFSAL